MKPDGVTMETTEPTEAAGEAEHSSLQDNITEQAPSQPEEAANVAATEVVPNANDKPVAADTHIKPKPVANKTRPTARYTGASGSNSRPHRALNDVKSSVSAVAVKKTATTAAKASGAVPKRPMGVTAVSTTVKSNTRVPDRKPVGPTKTTTVAAATVTNGTKPTTVNGTPKRRLVAETVNAPRPKTACASNRPVAFTAPKPSTPTSTKAGGAALSKTTRPVAAPSTSTPISTTSRATTATIKSSSTVVAKTTASRVTTVPSTGRATAAQTPKTAAAKKDGCRPQSATVTKKPATATSAVPKKSEPSKPAATAKLNSASKWSATAKAADHKVSQSKTQQPGKLPTKKPAAATKLPGLTKPPLGRTPPASPANKPANGSTSQAKRGTKPTQAVPPFTAIKKAEASNATTPPVEAQSAASATVAAATLLNVLAETQTQIAVVLPQGPFSAAFTPEEDSPLNLVNQEVDPQESVEEREQMHGFAQSPVRTSLPQTAPPQEQFKSSASLLTTQDEIPAPTDQTVATIVSPLNLSTDPVYLSTDQTEFTSIALPPAINGSPKIILPTNLNEEEDEEEREGSQLVSVSEMSGTTQPTEESRPGSAGLVGSALRAGGALQSELDSEDVSGSQQGASELSAPGVLEGTESMDDLGDGSLKGAIDMEGASAGSPDFEKVPDIPVNDFEDEDDDDEDDNDGVCDMDVGSEHIDEPQRPRHDNDVDDEDEDVEMASEGVTESGLESYGNPDEDDFAEDERLDNLNRVAQPPPPPPLLPFAPAAQWDQPNPFADPWAEPLQPQILENVSQTEQVAEATIGSPLTDPWQADSETPTQTPAQAWLEMGSAPCLSENQEVPCHSSAKDMPPNLEAQMYSDQSSPVPVQALTTAQLSAPGMSLSSTLSSETSTPEELGDYNHVEKLLHHDAQGLVSSPQPDLDSQNLCIHLESGDRPGEEREKDTMAADEILGAPVSAPTSIPSSSSVTEDEGSDTEGEAQLDDCLESSVVSHITIASQPPTQCSLSIVEEREEAEVEDVKCGVEDSTPPSATSLASYGFDTMTTTSNTHAHSTGESCIKSPGIFSLEELPEEAKDPCFIAQPHMQSCLAEKQYIECGKKKAESAEHVREVPGPDETLNPPSTLNTLQQPEEIPDDIQPPYYSAICEKTENFFAGFTALPHLHRRDYSAYPRTYCDIIKPHSTAVTPPKLTCADLPPRSLEQKALSPQLRRLEQHQRQLLELQQRKEQQSRLLEEAEQERKRRQEEEQKKRDEAEEEIKRNKAGEDRKIREQAEGEEEKVRKEELKQRKALELQLQEQQQELKQRQQIVQWQQELKQSNKSQTVLVSPSSGLCTIYEALENSEEEPEGEEMGVNVLSSKSKKDPKLDDCDKATLEEEKQDNSPPTENPLPLPHSPQMSRLPSKGEDETFHGQSESPEQPSPMDLDWGKKVDIVQQLINQTLLLNGDGCSSLLLLPGGAGGTLSPLESSLWPSLLPPLTPPSATVTSVSSFSPEATGSSLQGEWTVVELETHH
ncbi:hypothetical protein EXN66_Car003167 [Channa argus]|uniref:BTB/POZ domain-containing protein n=1 Tax=Channa argus TaxID=215402 RepID=A0A6G1PB62_CHAAH|nr:hypothetical protein EXN66_Car003167 [Channa argus]